MEDHSNKEVEFVTCTLAIKQEIPDECDDPCPSAIKHEISDECDDPCTSAIKQEIPDECDDPGASSLNEDLMDEEYSETEQDEGDYSEAFEPIVQIKEEIDEDDIEGDLSEQENSSKETVIPEGDESTSSVQTADLKYKGVVKTEKVLDLVTQSRTIQNANLDRLQSSVASKGPYTCGFCGKEFVKFGQNLRKHYIQHTLEDISHQSYNNSKLQKCTLCSYLAKDYTSLKEHISGVHENEELLHYCTLCTFSAKTTPALKKHISGVHIKEKPFECEVCKKTFTQKSGLNFHKLVHSSDRPFKCSDCPFETKTDNQLKRHILKKHAPEGPSVCETCGKTYSSKYDLKKHTAVMHLGKKPLQCNQCPYETIFAGDLRKHFAVHSDEKTFVCDVCGKGFPLKGRLHNHKMTHVQEEDKKFRCTVCPYTSVGSYHLRLHMTIHTGEKKFPCKFCDKGFATRERLKVHLNNVHSLKNGQD